MLFLEVSAKTAFNVEQSFFLTSKTILDKIQAKLIDPKNESLGIKIGLEGQMSNKKQLG